MLISEFLANPASTSPKPPGSKTATDWLELVNNGSSPVDLGGWRVSDSKNASKGFTLPARVLQPGEYLLIWLTAGEGQGQHGVMGGAASYAAVSLYGDSPSYLHVLSKVCCSGLLGRWQKMGVGFRAEGGRRRVGV